MSRTVHAFDYLEKSTTVDAVPSIVVIFGDEPFLQQLVLRNVRQAVLQNEADEVPFTTLQGDTAEWRDVLDELSMHSLFAVSYTHLTLPTKA